MTLENLRNLEKIGQLKSHVTGREEIQRFLEAARRNLVGPAVIETTIAYGVPLILLTEEEIAVVEGKS